MNKLIKFFQNFFVKKSDVREETKCLSMGGELEMYDSVESNYQVSKHLNDLMKAGKMKNYAKAIKFINQFDPISWNFEEGAEFNRDRVQVSDAIRDLGKTARILNYKCEDVDFIEWLKSLA